MCNTLTLTFFVRAYICTDLSFLVVHYSVINLSFKCHKDLIFRLSDICNIERCFYFWPALYVMCYSDYIYCARIGKSFVFAIEIGFKLALLTYKIVSARKAE